MKRDKTTPSGASDRYLIDVAAEDLQERTHLFRILKWIIVGIAAFFLVLFISFFFAERYIRTKVEITKKIECPKYPFKFHAERKEKFVIKRYKLKPFLLKVRDQKRGGDRFLLAEIYIKFAREKLPAEIKTRRGVLRMLVYKQLLKSFSEGRDSAVIRKGFKEELIPSLNTFFTDGGVYDIGFERLIVE